jgi:hypothetical protein
VANWKVLLLPSIELAIEQHVDVVAAALDAACDTAVLYCVIVL